MKVGTLLAHLSKSGSLQAPVVVHQKGHILGGIERVYFRKDGTLVINVKGG